MTQNKMIEIRSVYMCQDFIIDPFGRPIASGIIGPTFLYGLGPPEFLNLKIFGSVFSSFKTRKVVEVSLLDPNRREVVSPNTFFVNYSNDVYSMFVTSLNGNVSFDQLGEYKLIFRDWDSKEEIEKVTLHVINPNNSKWITPSGHFELPNGLQIPNDPKFMKKLKKDIEEYKENC